MSTQLVLGVAGAVVGASFGMPQLGWALGSVAGGLLQGNGPDVSPGDLSAPKLSAGSSIPRVSGTVPVPLSLVDVSAFTATANETGGKGGPPEGSAGYTYTIDVVGVLADGLNVIGFTRVWVNKVLKYTALASSTSGSLSASAVTDAWQSITLFTGAITQTPPPAYETRVGAGNATAFRHQCVMEIVGLACGGTQTPPLVEVEIITAGTPATVGALTKLQSNFDNVNDDSAYANGAGTITGSASVGAGLVVDVDHVLTPNTGGYIQWTGSAFAPNGSSAITFEGFAVWTQTPNVAGIIAAEIVPNAAFPTDYYRFGFYGNTGKAWVDTAAFGDQYVSATPVTSYHWALVFDATSVRAYINGVLVFETAIGAGILPAAATARVRIGDSAGYTSGRTAFTIPEFRLRFEAVYTGSSFAPPASLPPPDGSYNTWTPGTVTLKSIIDAELARNEAVELADWDTSACAAILVRGFPATGHAASTIQQLSDIFYIDTVPGNPIRFVQRGAAVVGSIPFADTGVGVDGPGDPFVGLRRGNGDELPAVYGLQYPNPLQDHDPGFERGDRFVSDGPDVRKVSTRVSLTPTEARGRAITGTLMARVVSQTASFGLSNKYAAAQAGDAYTVTAMDGTAYNLLIERYGYADGVFNADWQLYDTTALVQTGITSGNYTSSITVAALGVAVALPMDIPLLRDADGVVGAGHYVAMKTSDTSTARWLESPDGVTYTTAATYSTDAVFGSVTAVAGSLPALNVWDEGSTITVNVGAGTLASATRAALLADRAVNAFAVGVAGRWCLGQFRTATLVSAGIYRLSGLLLGQKGTEQYAAGITAGDSFALLTVSGTQYIARATSSLGVGFYGKAVAQRQSPSSITGAALTVNGISLKPLSPVRLRVDRNASTGDIAATWARRTRSDTRFGGALGDACPIGEASELYRVRLYTSSAFTTLLRDLGTVSAASVTYTAAQIAADSKTLADPLHADIRMVSAVIGEGYPLRDTA